MDPSSMFRGRLRKRGCEGVTKKGPLVAKHPSPPAPSPTSSTTSPAASPTLPSPHHTPPRKQFSPARGAALLAGYPLRPRGSSPDPRGCGSPTTPLPGSESPPNIASPVGSPPGSPKCSPVRVNEEVGISRTSGRPGPIAPSRTRPRPVSPQTHRHTPPTSPRTLRTSCNRPSSPSGVPSGNASIRSPSAAAAPSRGIIKSRNPPRSHSPSTPTDGGTTPVGGFPGRSDSPSSGIPRRIPFPSYRGTSPNGGGTNLINGGGPISRGISPSGSSVPVIRNNVVRGTSPSCAPTNIRGMSPTTPVRDNSRGGIIMYRGTSTSRGTSPSSGGVITARGVSPAGATNLRGTSPSSGINFRGTSPNGVVNSAAVLPSNNYRGSSPSGANNHRGYSPNGGSNIRRASPISANLRDGSPSSSSSNPRGVSPNGSSNARGASPGGVSTSTRGTSPNGSNIRGASPTGASSFRGTSPGSRCSSSSGISEEVVRGRVRRAIRARLYLLHQPGPNSFSVGGDSPTHKYKVIIGPQSCSCGHGPYCVHVLFVLVRVLQVPENSPVLLAGTLKDYEVEQLLSSWEERRKKAVRARERRNGGATSPSPTSASYSHHASSTPASSTSPCRAASGQTRGGRASPSGPAGARGAAGPGAGHDDSSGDDEEAQCPICLTVMVEGESLVACESGCRNLLHHHCMAVWAADRHSQMLPLLCPLCRAPWPAKTNPRLLATDSVQGTPVPSPPQPPHRPHQIHGLVDGPSRLPHPPGAGDNHTPSPSGPHHRLPFESSGAGAVCSRFVGGQFEAGSANQHGDSPARGGHGAPEGGGGMNESGYGSVVGLSGVNNQLGINGVNSGSSNFISNNSGNGGGSHFINGSGRDVNSISSNSNNYHYGNGRGAFGFGNIPVISQQQLLHQQQQFPVYRSSNNVNYGNHHNNNNQYQAGSSSRPSLSSRHLNQQQQQHHQYQHSSQHPAAGVGPPSKSVPALRSSATPSSGRPRGNGYPPGMSASFSGSVHSRGSSVHAKSAMPRSQSQSNTNQVTHSPSTHQSPFADSAYSSPLLPNFGAPGGHSRNSSTSKNYDGNSGYHSSNKSGASKRSSSNSRIPRCSSPGSTNSGPPSSRFNGSSLSNPHVPSSSHGPRHHGGVAANQHLNNPLPSGSAQNAPLGMPPHLERGLQGYYPPTLRGEVSAAMVADVSDDEVPLPRSEPIPTEHEESAAAWVAVFGRELVACLFSRDWAVRETGLRRLAHEVVKVLHWDQLVTGEETQKKVVHCCANILAQVVNDPVYKVYLACLRVVRVLLSHLTLSVPGEVCWLQELLRPLLHTLLLKCADGNRRTSQISVDSLLELSRGQEGELALGGGQGLSLGGVQYVLSCILDEAPPQEAPWQWLLGRLCVLDRLLDQFPEQFQIQMVSLQPLESGYKLQHYDRLMTVVEFAFKALGSSHATVAKLARRVYICGARMAAAEPNVFRHVCDMLSKLDISLQMRLKRRLRSLQGQHSRPSFSSRLPDHPMHKPRSQIEASLRPYISSALPRLVRSVSHSPSRLLSAARSPSQSPVREQSVVTPTLKPKPPNKPPELEPKPANTSNAAGVALANSGSGGSPNQSSPNNAGSPNSAGSPTSPNSNNQSSRSSSGDAAEGNTDASGSGSLQPAVKQSPPRPTHLPLDSLHMKFKDKQARVRQYHKSRPRQEEPIIVQHALITPKSYKNQQKSSSSNKKTSSNQNNNNGSKGSNDSSSRKSAAPLLRRGGLSQSHGDNLDLSPRTPIGPPLPNFTFKEAIASPTTPNAPFTTPVKEVTHPIMSAKLQSDVDSLAYRSNTLNSDDRRLVEQPLPKIPNLLLLPPYLEQDVGSSQERIAEESQNLYEEGNEWVRGQLLGSGAFSCCYQARDIATGTLMAVKLVSFVRNSSEEQERVEAAVEDEILLMSQLRHRNIVRLMGSVRHTTSFCVFTEWMAGGSVSAMLERYGPFGEHVILRYIKQVLHGLDYLHDNMILHRDLKGANLLIDSTGELLRIGDFGTAARLASKSTVTGEFQGQLLGTIAFMAPEVLRGDDYGRACDIWSVGCCIIEMATTKPPWDADHVSNQYKLMFKIATSNGPPVVPAQLSDNTRAMALHCLQTNSDDRPTAKDLLRNAAFNPPPPLQG